MPDRNEQREQEAPQEAKPLQRPDGNPAEVIPSPAPAEGANAGREGRSSEGVEETIGIP